MPSVPHQRLQGLQDALVKLWFHKRHSILAEQTLEQRSRGDQDAELVAVEAKGQLVEDQDGEYDDGRGDQARDAQGFVEVARGVAMTEVHEQYRKDVDDGDVRQHYDAGIPLLPRTIHALGCSSSGGSP